MDLKANDDLIISYIYVKTTTKELNTNFDHRRKFKLLFNCSKINIYIHVWIR